MNGPAVNELRNLRDLFHGIPTGSVIPDVAVSGLSIDSRDIAPGSLFLALRGTRGHGLDYARQAVDAGAIAVAWEPAEGLNEAPLAVPSLRVEGLSAQAGRIAARFYDDPSTRMFVAGVTGTDGKTSTAHLIAQGLDLLGVVCGYLGTIGYGRLGNLATSTHTTFDAVRLQKALAELLQGGAEACAMEVSSHALDQHRVAGVKFAAAVLTNVGRDHLDYHGTEEQYTGAKRRLFTDCAPAVAILNRDDTIGARWADELQVSEGSEGRLIRYGRADSRETNGHRFVAQRIDTRPDGLRIEVDSHLGRAVIASPLLGTFNAYNLLAALAVICARGAPLADACAALSRARTVPGRMEAFAGPLFRARVVVDYAHTPQALAAALKALRAHVEGRLICVFGCGGDRDRGKRPLMGAAAAELADCAIATDDNPRSELPEAIVAEVLAGVPQTLMHRLVVEHDRARAIERAVRMAGDGDIVLVAGKGHEDYQIYGRQSRHFSDREFVAGLLGSETVQ
jgi:UDP-N-acetylmuramoyl-L-alanyl-D-glutamate--2,6-diaminopimelate ligase